MVEHAAVAHEGALVDAAGHYRLPAHGNAGERCGLQAAARRHGRTQAHVPCAAIGFAAQARHVAAQVDHAAGCAAVFQQVNHPICDISLRHAAKVDHCLRVGDARLRPLNLHVAPIDVRKRFGNGSIIRHDPALEIP